ncbi:hypothetical protein ACLOJK_021526 [Asimina triloba]
MDGNCNLELHLVPTSNAAGADAHSPNSSSSGCDRFAITAAGMGIQRMSSLSLIVFFYTIACFLDPQVAIVSQSLLQAWEFSEWSERESTGSSEHLTIFYSGRVCVCDLIEIQVRAILCLAKREMDQRLAKGSADPWQQQQLQPRAPALSMKRSLQRFLQKRNSRIQETAPYGQ